MIHSLDVSARLKPDWSLKRAVGFLEHYLLTNATASIKRYRHRRDGWDIELPRHRFNTLSGAEFYGVPDMMIGKATLRHDGTLTVTILVEWGLLEHRFARAVAKAANHGKGELERHAAVVRAREELILKEDELAELLSQHDVPDAGIQEARHRAAQAQNRLDRAVARCRTDGDRNKHSFLEELTYWPLVADLARWREDGVTGLLLTPAQVEDVVVRYVTSLLRLFPFLDPCSVTAGAMTVYFQWDMPDLVDLFAALRHEIIKRPASNVDITDPSIIRIGGRDRLRNHALHMMPGNVLRMMRKISMKENDSGGFISVGATSANSPAPKLMANWEGVVGLLGKSVGLLPLVGYTNDLERLLKCSDARKAAAVVHHPQARVELPPRVTKGIERYPTVQRNPPVLAVPSAPALIRAGSDDLLEAWPAADGTICDGAYCLDHLLDPLPVEAATPD